MQDGVGVVMDFLELPETLGMSDRILGMCRGRARCRAQQPRGVDQRRICIMPQGEMVQDENTSTIKTELQKCARQYTMVLILVAIAIVFA